MVLSTTRTSSEKLVLFRVTSIVWNARNKTVNESLHRRRKIYQHHLWWSNPLQSMLTSGNDFNGSLVAIIPLDFSTKSIAIDFRIVCCWKKVSWPESDSWFVQDPKGCRRSEINWFLWQDSDDSLKGGRITSFLCFRSARFTYGCVRSYHMILLIILYSYGPVRSVKILSSDFWPGLFRVKPIYRNNVDGMNFHNFFV